MTSKKIEAKMDEKGRYLGCEFEVPIFSGDKAQVLNILTKQLDKKGYEKPYFVVTINTEMLVNSENDLAYKKVLQSADLLIPDTNGLRLLGVKNIYPGRKLVEDLLLMNKYRAYYLGGWGDVPKLMAEKYGGEWKGEINKYKPDLLLVAYGGGPKQERWISDNLHKIKAKVVIGVGGTFDYLTGKAKLPPRWMEKMGLEWLWRLYQEPKRWRRQLKLIEFVVKVIKTKLL